MSRLDKYMVFDDNGAPMCHRSPLKVILNPVLRFLQPWTNKPWVIASIVEDKKFIRYCFMPVEKRRE